MSRSEVVAESAVLFHGPSSQTRATMAASDWGRVVGVFGDPVTGINAETARAVVAAASSPYVGDRRTSLVVGPVDVGTSDGVNDPMLKVLEEPDPTYPRVHLWAWDEGEALGQKRTWSIPVGTTDVTDAGMPRPATAVARMASDSKM